MDSGARAHQRECIITRCLPLADHVGPLPAAVAKRWTTLSKRRARGAGECSRSIRSVQSRQISGFRRYRP